MRSAVYYYLLFSLLLLLRDGALASYRSTRKITVINEQRLQVTSLFPWRCVMGCDEPRAQFLDTCLSQKSSFSFPVGRQKDNWKLFEILMKKMQSSKDFHFVL